ncbi:NUDIX hydrolase [Desulforamulus reducens]|nr:CoA pyrophosphatase [Desulforamulus reducens]
MKLDELLKSSLSERPSIQGVEDYFNSVVLVLLILINEEYHLVFQKRCSAIRQGGEVSFPGGKYEPDKDLTLENTAIRETWEEMGIPANKITIIGRLDTLVAPMGTIIDAFVGIADINVDDIQLNPDEVERVFTVPLDYFLQNEPERYFAVVKVHPSYIDEKNRQEVISFPAEALGLPERYRQPWGNLKYGILVYNTKEEKIWGVTARIIENLIKKLKKSNIRNLGKTNRKTL